MHARSSYPVGEFIVVVRDKDTGAVKRVQREKNIVANRGVEQFLGNNPIWLNNGGDVARHMVISNRRVPEDV